MQSILKIARCLQLHKYTYSRTEGIFHEPEIRKNHGIIVELIEGIWSIYVAQKFSNLSLALTLIYWPGFCTLLLNSAGDHTGLCLFGGQMKGLWMLFGEHFRHYVSVQTELSHNREERILNFSSEVTRKIVTNEMRATEYWCNL